MNLSMFRNSGYSFQRPDLCIENFDFLLDYGLIHLCSDFDFDFQS